MDYLWVGLGGFIGANTRYALSQLVAHRLGTSFPYGTLLINITGSLLIGIVMTLVAERLLIDPLWRRLAVVGFLGGYTTFSTYTYDAILLAEQGAWGQAAAYILGSNGLGLLACYLGIVAGRAIAG